MRNLWTLVRREYLERVRSRSFVIFTLLMPAGLGGAVAKLWPRSAADA